MVYEQIREHIERNGVSLSLICSKSGMPERDLALALSGRRRLSPDEFMGVCDALDVEPNQFMPARKAE